MIYCGLCDVMNLSRPGHLKICCCNREQTIDTITVYIFVDVMLITKENIIFLVTLYWQLDSLTDSL